MIRKVTQFFIILYNLLNPTMSFHSRVYCIHLMSIEIDIKE